VLVRAESIDEEACSFDVVWTTGATVRRRRLFDDDIDEQLVVSEGSVRLDRLNSGAPFLDTHNAWSLAGMLGVVEEGSARIEGGRGHARVRLSDRDDVEPVWRDIRAGIIRNVSVGYRVHRFEIERRDGEVDLWRAVDWEPMEISAVPMGADPDVHVRSAEGREDALTSCRLVRRRATADAAATLKDETMDKHDEVPAGGAGSVETREAKTATAAPAGAAEASAAAEGQRGAEGQRSGNGSGTVADPTEAARRAVAEERRRVAAIDQLCRRHGLDGAFADDLVASGAGLEAARTAILDRLAEQEPMQGWSEQQPAVDRAAPAREGEGVGPGRAGASGDVQVQGVGHGRGRTGAGVSPTPRGRSEIGCRRRSAAACASASASSGDFAPVSAATVALSSPSRTCAASKVENSASNSATMPSTSWVGGPPTEIG
jgi:hypothetical protein